MAEEETEEDQHSYHSHHIDSIRKMKPINDSILLTHEFFIKLVTS